RTAAPLSTPHTPLVRSMQRAVRVTLERTGSLLRSQLALAHRHQLSGGGLPAPAGPFPYQDRRRHLADHLRRREVLRLSDQNGPVVLRQFRTRHSRCRFPSTGRSEIASRLRPQLGYALRCVARSFLRFLPRQQSQQGHQLWPLLPAIQFSSNDQTIACSWTSNCRSSLSSPSRPSRQRFF